MVCRGYFPKCVAFLFAILFVLSQVAPNPVLAQDVPSDGNRVTPQAIEIVGGQPATPGEWPWQALIFIGGSSQCGGSLIHPRWVLTAAHCVGNAVVNYALPSDFQVILGDHNPQTPDGSEQTRSVIQVVVHPNWRQTSTNNNDIALLKLDIPVTLNSRVAVVPLVVSPTDDHLLLSGATATVTGWGTTSPGGQAADILQEVQLPIVSNTECDAAMPQDITGNMLCAGFPEGARSSCQGDSGGPVVVPDGNGGWKQASLVSFGPIICDQAGGFSVSTRVSQYIAWIQSYINSPNGPTPIRNAEFELGQNGDWNEITNNGLDLVTNQGLPVTPHSGSYVAWLGGVNSESSSIGQIITLNERATGLTFYYQIQSPETECTFDIGAVVVNGSTQGSIPLCTATASSAWAPATIDLSNFAGRTIIFGINAQTDSLSPSSQFIDDVAIATSPVSPLSVTNFTPASGKTGATVTLNGSNFLDVTEVLFNGVASSFTVQSDSVLSVAVPAQSSTGAITVKTAYSTTNSSHSFSVLHPLTVATAGSGSGTVTSNPSGISCSGDCSEDYSDSTEVTLSAQPAANSIFTGWSGACSGTAPECIIDMNEAKSAIATFTLKAFTLSAGKSGNGSVSSAPAGITCGVDCSESYTINTDVTLTATAGDDSEFAGWSGACMGTGACSVTMNSANSVFATFTLKSYALTVNVAGSGTVIKNPTQATYTHGTVVNLTATASDGFTFSGWSGACTGTEDCTVTMNSAKSVTATFTKVDTPANDAPYFTSTPLLSTTIGASYTYVVSALDPDAGDTLTLSAPIKPDWLTFTPNGNGTATLSGTPLAAHVGENPVQLQVHDASNAFTAQEFTIIVTTDDPASTGNIQGIVKDAEGNGLAGAEVTLTDGNGEVIAAILLTTITDSNGNYLFEGVPFGEYSIIVHIEGMEPSVPSPVTVQAGQTTTVPAIVLQPSKDAIHLPLLGK